MSEAEPTRSARMLASLQNKRGVALVVVIATIIVGVASTSKSLKEIYDLASAHYRIGAVPVVLPRDTGWVFCGYFDNERQLYVQGPYCSTVRTPFHDTSLLPRVGELVRLTADRRVVIADFATQGVTRRFDPPWQQNVLSDGDYTGITLASGAVVEVRDVSGGAFPGKPTAVWARVGNSAK